MSKTLCIVNHKGGVGKTHTCFHLAGALADAGKRVLAVDLDAQANLSRLLLESLQGATLYDVLHDQVELAEVIQATQLRGIDLAPSDVRLEDLASVLRDEPDQQIRLDTAIRERQSQPNPYEFVIVDCPPSLTLPTRNALAAADGVVIPLEADKFSLDGLQRLLELIERMRRVNPRLAVEGVLISLYNGRRAIERTFEQALQSFQGIRVLPVRIKNSAKYREAITARVPISHYLPVGPHADAFRELARIVSSPAGPMPERETTPLYAQQH